MPLAQGIGPGAGFVKEDETGAVQARSTIAWSDEK